MNHLLALVLVLVSSFALANPLPTVPHIYIEGSAEIEVIPDQMTITLGLSAEHMEVSLAKQEVDKRSMQLLATLKKMSIDAKDIATTALQIAPVYDYVEGKQVLRGNRVYRQVDITLKNLDKYGELMQALMAAKISETVDTRLAVSDEKLVSDQALVKALEDARLRAASLVESQGRKLAGLHSISEFDLRREESHMLVPNREIFGASSPEMLASGDMRAKSAEPFEPGVIRAKAKVYVVYLIK